jgi:hypothetical protein
MNQKFQNFEIALFKGNEYIWGWGMINVVKTSRLRFAGRMIRKPEDPPQKADVFIANRKERGGKMGG